MNIIHLFDAKIYTVIAFIVVSIIVVIIQFIVNRFTKFYISDSVLLQIILVLFNVVAIVRLCMTPLYPYYRYEDFILQYIRLSLLISFFGILISLFI